MHAEHKLRVAKDLQNGQFETLPYFRDKFVILSALDVYYRDLYEEPCT